MTEHLDVSSSAPASPASAPPGTCRTAAPTKSYAILERRENLGGTWDLFKYPGIRSDSDMFTLGFRFKPWTSEKAIADGPSILSYLKEAAAEYGIDENIRYSHKVIAADWSDADNRWTVTRRPRRRGGRRSRRSFLFAAHRLLQLRRGLLARVPRAPRTSTGTIVHPQHWPEDLDYAGKKIVVIGSGATAVTLIPALVNSGAGHVTMLQRSPTYIGSLPDVDPIAVQMNKTLPDEARLRGEPVEGILFSRRSTRSAGKFPNFMRKTLLTMAQRRLPEGYDVEKHFGPQLQPVGRAAVPGAQRRSVQDHPQGQRRRRHRHHRHASPRRASS